MSAFFDLDEDGQHRGRGRSRPAPSTDGRFTCVWSEDQRCIGSTYRHRDAWEAWSIKGERIGSTYPSLSDAVDAVRRAS